MSENISYKFQFKFGAADVLSGLESTHGTRSLLLFSVAAMSLLAGRQGAVNLSAGCLVCQDQPIPESAQANAPPLLVFCSLP